MTISRYRGLLVVLFVFFFAGRKGGDGLGTTAEAAPPPTFVVAGANPSLPDGARLLSELFQTFSLPAGTVPPSGSGSPSLTVLVTRLLPPGATPPEMSEDVYFDLYDLGTGWGVPPDDVPPVTTQSGAQRCAGSDLASTAAVPATLIGEGRLATLSLTYDVQTPVTIPFATKGGSASITNGHWYGLWIHVPAPAIMRLGIASQTPSGPVPSVTQTLWTRQPHYLDRLCRTNPLWVEDGARVLTFGFTPGNG